MELDGQERRERRMDRERLPGWQILAVAAALLITMAGAIFKAPNIDNALAWILVGASLILVGVWLCLAVQTATRINKARRVVTTTHLVPEEDPGDG